MTKPFNDLKFYNPENAILVVFPQLWSVDDVEDRSIFPSIVIARSQLRETEEEVRVEKASVTIVMEYRPTCSRPRTREVTHGAASGAVSNGFLEGR